MSPNFRFTPAEERALRRMTPLQQEIFRWNKAVDFKKAERERRRRQQRITPSK